MNEINWVSKSHAYTRGFKDVTINVINDKNKGVRAHFALHNNSKEKLTKTNYLIVGLCGNRIYFREANSIVGYKCVEYSSGASKTHYVRPNNSELAEFCLSHKGDYTLKFDAQLKNYYIEVED